MPRIAWLTDIHLNFVSAVRQEAFYERLRTCGADLLLLGGDIAESTTLMGFLRQIDRHVQRPIYFVLGNHDFYRGSIRDVRGAVSAWCHGNPRAVYLSNSEPVCLMPGVGLVGHDGWADGLLGDYLRSVVMMNDYRLIDEFIGLDKQARWDQMRALGDDAATHIDRVLPTAFSQFDKVYLLTHVPPFREACWYDGRMSDDYWMPHFTCASMGESIRSTMKQRPDKKLTVLCGHTHGAGVCEPLANVRVITGGAEYGEPGITDMWDLSPRAPA